LHITWFGQPIGTHTSLAIRPSPTGTVHASRLCRHL